MTLPCSNAGLPSIHLLQLSPDSLAVDQRVIGLTKRLDEMKSDLQDIKNQQAAIPNFFKAIASSGPVKYFKNVGLAALGMNNG